MIRSLRQARLSRGQAAVLACASLIASAIVVSGAIGRSPAQNAALAALRHGPGIVRVIPSGARSEGNGITSATAGAAGNQSGSSSSTGTSSASQPAQNPASSGSTGGSTGTGSPPIEPAAAKKGNPATSKLPKVEHVFDIALTTPTFADAFGAHSDAPYLRTLVKRGTLLRGFDSLGAGELPDVLAMVSGQSPNADTRSGCPTYIGFAESDVANSAGVVPGTGCVYPETALTVGDQVTASGHVWRAYIDAMGSTNCLHPNSGEATDIPLTGSGPTYDLLHNPFVYFHSLLDLGDCQSDDMDLGHLASDLSKASHAPMYSFISPDLCSDAGTPAAVSADATAPTNDTSSTPTTTAPATTSAVTTTTPASSTSTISTTPATMTAMTPASTTSTTTQPPPIAAICPSGQPLGLAAENAFLRQWVPKIIGSAGYRKHGVLLITFAASRSSANGRPFPVGALVLSRTRGRADPSRRDTPRTRSCAPWSRCSGSRRSRTPRTPHRSPRRFSRDKRTGATSGIRGQRAMNPMKQIDLIEELDYDSSPRAAMPRSRRNQTVKYVLVATVALSLLLPAAAEASPVLPPTVTSSFTPPLIGVGDITPTALGITITNPNTSATLSGIGFTDTLPTGVTIDTPNGESGTCGSAGVVTATSGTSTFALSGGSLKGGTSCTVSVSVAASVPGTVKNDTGLISSSAGSSAAGDTETLTVLRPRR